MGTTPSKHKIIGRLKLALNKNSNFGSLTIIHVVVVNCTFPSFNWFLMTSFADDFWPDSVVFRKNIEIHREFPCESF